MNYHGTWVHAGNYSRILLVGDIFANSIVATLQRECPSPVDVVYADTADELLELALVQMERLSYSLVILCALMASCTFEDKVHYRYEDYTELSAQVLQLMQNGLT